MKLKKLIKCLSKYEIIGLYDSGYFIGNYSLADLAVLPKNLYNYKVVKIYSGHFAPLFNKQGEQLASAIKINIDIERGENDE